MPRQYLLWTLRDLLDIINGTESNFVSTFLEKLTFSQLYDFTKTQKQFIYNKDIPHTSCFCDTCGNTVLLAERTATFIISSSRKPSRYCGLNTAALPTTNSARQIIVKSVPPGNFAHYLSTFRRNLIPILLLTPMIPIIWYLFIDGKHPTSTLRKYKLENRSKKLQLDLRNPSFLSRVTFTPKGSKTVITTF